MIQRWELFITLLVVSALFSWWRLGRFHWVAAFLCGFVLTSAVHTFQDPALYNNIVNLKFRLVSARSFALVVMLVFLVTQLTLEQTRKSLEFFKLLALVDSLLILTKGFGLMNANSADVAFIIAVYPMIFFSEKDWAWPANLSGMFSFAYRLCLFTFPIAALITAKTSTGFLVMAAVVVAYCIYNGKWRLLVGGSLAVVAFGYFVAGSEIFNSSDRLRLWPHFMKWWWENASIFTGTGTGTFQWYGPLVHGLMQENQLWIWMHNEYLQIIFEQGLVGFAAASYLMLICIRRSLSNEWLFLANVAFLTQMLTQFPLRYPVTQLLALVLMRLSLEEKPNAR